MRLVGTEQLLLIAVFWNEVKEARALDRERRFARAMGVPLEIFSAYTDTLHPPGVEHPYTNCSSGRRRRRNPPKRIARRAGNWEGFEGF